MTALDLDLSRPAVEVAPRLLGAVLRHRTDEGVVAIRLTEVEAYLGIGEDPGSHAHRRVTPRNAVMFGPAGAIYVYFTYGMHSCANIVCSPEGSASAVLLRGGEIVEGVELARRRRGAHVADRDLARGPARLTVALGITLAETGSWLPGTPAADAATAVAGTGVGGTSTGASPAFELRPAAEAAAEVAAGPRTGVAGAGGGADYPWRFWVPGEPTVSPYRAAVTRVRARTS